MGLKNIFKKKQKTEGKDLKAQMPKEKVQAEEKKGRAAQKKRWAKRQKDRQDIGLRIRKEKGTKKGAQKGAFGKRQSEVDSKPALKPKEMKAHAVEQQKKLGFKHISRKKWRKKVA